MKTRPGAVEGLPLTPQAGVSIGSLQELDPARFQNFVIWAIRVTLLAYALTTVIGMARAPEQVPSRVGEFVVLAILVVASRVHHRGYARQAGILLVLSVYVELHFSLVFDGIAGAPGLVAAPVLVLGTGLFWGLRHAWGMTAAVMLGVLSALVLHNAAVGDVDLLPLGTFLADPDVQADLAMFGFVAIVSLVTAFLTSLSLRSLGGLVAQAEASRRRFSVLVERTPDALVGLDDQGRVETVNRAAIELLQADASDLQGRPLTELELPGGTRLGDRLPLDTDGDEASGQILVKLPFPGGMRDLEVRIRSLPRDDGQPGRMVLLRDVTEVREAQERQAQLGRIVDEALHEIHVFSRDDLAVLFLNRGARENLGYQGEALPHRIDEVNPSLNEEFVTRLAREPRSGEARIHRGIQRRRDGSVYPVECVFQPGSFHGKPAVVAFTVDITERVNAEDEAQRLQQQLEHSQRLKVVGQLAGGVAHDFNNLLTVMGACAESLRDEVPPGSQDLVDELITAQERGAVLTRQLLAFARKEVVQPEVLRVSEALEGMDALARKLLTERVALEVRAAPELHIRADRGQFEQILANLLANARDALTEGGTVRITATRDEGSPGASVPGPRLCLEIQDDGVGMDAATRDRIFEPFFTTKPRGKGTGLGLATVHGIVEQNQGAVEVESAPGQGTTFRIYWPLEEPEAESPDSESEDVSSGEASVRILFAEDNDTARVLLTRLLERSGHTVTAAANGDEALRVYREAPDTFDFLLSDVVMPGLSGIELADRITEDGFSGPVLFISGYLDGHLPRKGGAGTNRDLLLKPFRHDELLARIQSLLAEARAETL